MPESDNAHPNEAKQASGRTTRLSGWSIDQVVDAVDGRFVARGAASVDELCVSRVCSDTRQLRAGELFVALRGDNFDGHAFLAAADQAGAAVALVDHVDGLAGGVPVIVVDDTLDGLTALGHALWREATDRGMHTIDVTGSNGKTTVKEMLGCLWAEYGSTFVTPGNLNNHIGVPLTLCDVPADCEHMVVELGANAVGEISELVALAPGAHRIITSIGLAHLDGFGSVDGIRRGKAEIFESADTRTTAIVPFDEADHLIGDGFAGRVLTVGFDPRADVSVSQVDSDGTRRGQTISIRCAQAAKGPDTWQIELPIPGRHNALNLGSALATLVAAGIEIDPPRCSANLDELRLPDGRWRRVEVGDYRFVDDAYNANPTSVQASFETFMSELAVADWAVADCPRVAMIGEMHELGDDARRLHRQVAAELAEDRRLDGLVFVGRYAGAMTAEADACAPGSLEVFGCQTPQQAADWLVERGPACVFLKASRAAKLERVIDLVDRQR